jgi:hypothetical protein
VYWNGNVLYITAGFRVAQWVRSLDITTHTSLSPIRSRLCKLQKRGLRRHRLRQHLKQDMKFKCTTNYWLIRPAMVNKNLSHVITVTTNCQAISQSSWGRDSSTCSERIISSGLLTFFSADEPIISGTFKFHILF